MSQPVVTRRASTGDLDDVARVLGAAFADYPWTRWCVDATDHVARITELQRISLELLGLADGLVWLVEVGDAAVAAAVWSDSRTRVDPSLLAILADRSRPWHGNRLHAAIVAERNSFPRPDHDHLFLETMGTLPEHQRHGHGARVLRPGLDMADEQDLSCALETSTAGNVAFYRTLGFEIVHHRTVPGGGPDVWSMWRPSG